MMKLIPFFMLLAMFQSVLPSAEANMDMKYQTPTKEMREVMAKSHEKMAECLRTDKDFMECHAEMKKSCSDTMGENCSMMDGMMKKGIKKGYKKKTVSTNK